MKLHYHPETDSLHIELKNSPATGVREVFDGIVFDLDADGNVVGFDIEHASRKCDLSRIETIALPAVSAAENALADTIAVDSKEARRLRALDNLSKRNWTLPEDYKFDRDEANER